MMRIDSVTVQICTLGLGAVIMAQGIEQAIAPPLPPAPLVLGQQASPVAEELLDTHNRYREEVGVPPLSWSSSLAESADDWAAELAAEDRFVHSDLEYGENLWKGTAGQFSPTQMVESWGNEKQYFIANQPFPNVSTTGNWMDVGHYTQIVWEETTEVGCAIATGHGWDVLVCHYNPPGNFMGEQPF